MATKQICAASKQEFIVSDADLALLELLSPVYDGKTYLIPPPKLCPEKRFQRRTSWRNERNLYSTKCAKTGKKVISIHHPESPFPVYDRLVWWSDDWDPKSYGRDFDFSKGFFEQFAAMRNQVPRLPLLCKDSLNSDFTNHSANNKNCYICFIVFGSEDSYYSRKIFSCRNVMDCTFIFHNGELLYECYWGENLYDCRFCAFCSTCSDLAFCYDCKSCKNCFMSTNLRNQQYVFRNKQLSKEQYLDEVRKIDFGSRRVLKQLTEDYETIYLQAINPALRLDDCEDVVGDFLMHAKNCYECYYAALGEDCRYCVEFDRSADNHGSVNCMDSFGFGACELLYEVHAQANGFHNLFCTWSYDVANSVYLDMCFNLRDCFGCVGLHSHEQNCFFNKSFVRHEYEKLVAKVIGHMQETGEWGEFFPVKYSPFGYNETVAMEYFPLSKQEAHEQGLNWSDLEAPKPAASKVIPAVDLPDNIQDVEDSILDAAICCSKSDKLFKISSAELAFYRKMGIALPELHFDERHAERNRYRNPLQLWERSCAVSGVKVLSSFSPERLEVVLSEQSYRERLY